MGEILNKFQDTIHLELLQKINWLQLVSRNFYTKLFNVPGSILISWREVEVLAINESSHDSLLDLWRESGRVGNSNAGWVGMWKQVLDEVLVDVQPYFVSLVKDDHFKRREIYHFSFPEVLHSSGSADEDWRWVNCQLSLLLLVLKSSNDETDREVWGVSEEKRSKIKSLHCNLSSRSKD
jgi:hypothetical protein